MSKKVMRTIYFSEEVDAYLKDRMIIEDRKRSALVERLIKKCIQMEIDQDTQIAMAAKSMPDQN